MQGRRPGKAGAGGGTPLPAGEAGQAYWDGAAPVLPRLYSVLESPGDLHWVVPLKFSFDETDLHGGCSLREPAAQPVLSQGLDLCSRAPAAGMGKGEAEAFLLWLYASEQGQSLRLCGTQAEGLPDFAAALPAALGRRLAARARSPAAKRNLAKIDRAAYAAALLEQLQE